MRVTFFKNNIPIRENLITPLINIGSDDHWTEDCLRFRGHGLFGEYSHWCWDWDGLPVDETCKEWPCACKEDLEQMLLRVIARKARLDV